MPTLSIFDRGHNVLASTARSYCGKLFGGI